MSCGGRITLNNDISEVTIESPNRPLATPANSECEWIVLAPSGHAVQLDLVGQLDIAGSGFMCRAAGLEIRDGGTLVAPLIAKYCGSITPGTLRSSGNTIHVRYFNTVQNPGTGFQARISIGTLLSSLA